MSASNESLFAGIAPFGWARWIHLDDDDVRRAQFSAEEPKAYDKRIPLFTATAVKQALDAARFQAYAQPHVSKAGAHYASDYYAARRCYPSLVQAFEAGVAHASNSPTIEEMCARIKAADDAAADNDYMLDSNDCIRVLRGQWQGAMAADYPQQKDAFEQARDLDVQIKSLQAAQDRLLEAPAQALMAKITESNVINEIQAAAFLKEIDAFPVGFYRSELRTALVQKTGSLMPGKGAE